MDTVEIIDSLIQEGELLAETISFVPAPPDVWRTYRVYATSSKQEYADWQSAVKRLIKTYFSSETEEIETAFKKLSPGGHSVALGVLRAVKKLPFESTAKSSNRGPVITINNSQYLNINIVHDAVQDALTGKDYKELKELLSEYKEGPPPSDNSKTKVVEKIRSLGNDVATNIMANILTNPQILNGLF